MSDISSKDSTKNLNRYRIRTHTCLIRSRDVALWVEVFISFILRLLHGGSHGSHHSNSLLLSLSPTRPLISFSLADSLLPLPLSQIRAISLSLSLPTPLSLILYRPPYPLCLFSSAPLRLRVPPLDR
jgi:hypothetical protein